MVKPETAKMLSIMGMVVPELANETGNASAAPVQEKREWKKNDDWKKKDDWKNKDGNRGGDWKNKEGNRGDWKNKDGNRGDWKNQEGNRGGDWKNKEGNRGDWKNKEGNRGGDWKNKEGNRGDWKNQEVNRGGDWKNKDGNRGGDWKNKEGNRGGDWKNKDGNRGGDWKNQDGNRGGDWKNKEGNRGDWKNKDDWKKKEEGEEPEAPAVDDYIHFAEDAFDQKSSSKLKKKFQAKQAFKDYMSAFRDQKSGENNQDSILAQKAKKSKALNAKRPAGETEEYSSNWMTFLKKQKTETPQTKKTNKNAKNVKKSNQSGAVLTPLRPIAGTYAGPTPLIAVDCEMVLVEGNVQALARCSIVNYNGHVLFDKLVKPTKKVENYLPKITGLSYSKLKHAGTFETYKEEIHSLLSGRTLVGHTLKGDFEVLKYLPEEHLIRDLSHYRTLREDGKLLGLKKLTEKHLKFRIQTAEHDSNEDARAAMALYRKFEKQWEGELKEQRIALNPIAPQKAKKTQKESAKEEPKEKEEQEEQEESENENEEGGDEEGEEDFDFNDLEGDDDDDGAFN